MKLMQLSLTISVALLLIACKQDEKDLHHIQGQTMGTIVYNVKYLGKSYEQLKDEIDNELNAFNQSLSTYIPGSEISRLNRFNELSFESKYFYPVLAKSKEIFEKTDKTFDPTVGPLIRAWGFGPEGQIPDMDSMMVDSLKSWIGYDQVNFTETSAAIPANFQLDFSAIAKGYAVDAVGQLLESKGISNYLVEIGGEVRCRGVNEENKSWSLGIEDPTVSKDQPQELLAVVRLKDNSLATSGNYRNYYEVDGRIYAHIIDPRTGYNAQHNLLSASVFASDCMTADAYATAFMVLGLEESKRIIEREEIEGFLVYLDDSGEMRSFISKGIEPFMELNKAN